MRSLASKLTLAFVFVGLIGALSVAGFTWQRTRSAFDRFVLDRNQRTLNHILSTYYEGTGRWRGVEDLFRHRGPLADRFPGPLLVANSEGIVVYSEGRFGPGTQVTPAQFDQTQLIVVDGITVGWYVPAPPTRIVPGAPEWRFLDDLRWSTLLSAFVAVVLALPFGIWLTRSLTRPIRELTAAAKRMAQGDLDQQVAVRSQDELGDLAHAFNQMSHDLAQAIEARRQMTADVAHDLRTPLTVLMGYTEPLQEGHLEGTPELYAIMHEEVLHLKHLIEDLRTLSLADAGELRLHRRPVDTKALLERTGLAFMALAERKDVQLRVAAAGDLPLLDVDVERTTQVLKNLVSNALRHTPAGGEIVLSAEFDAAAGRIHLAVRDTGAGIALEALPHIFDRFYRADKSRERMEGESGLGLAIAKSIVRAHGGTVKANSVPGQGTTFTISLPPAEADSPVV